MHNDAIAAAILCKGIIKVTHSQDPCRYLVVKQECLSVTTEGWVIFNGIAPHTRTHGFCVIGNGMAWHVRYINDGHSDDERTLNSLYQAFTSENAEDM